MYTHIWPCIAWVVFSHVSVQIFIYQGAVAAASDDYDNDEDSDDDDSDDDD